MGDTVGTFSDAKGTHGFLWSAGKITVIDYPGAAKTYLTGINDGGVLVGYYSDTSTHAFEYQATKFTTLFPATCSDSYTCFVNQAVGINNKGQILAMYGYDIVVVQPDGKITTVMRGASYPNDLRATGINDAGDIVGWMDTGNYPNSTGLLFSSGQMITIPAAGYTGVNPYGINSRGQIVGVAASTREVLEFVTSCEPISPQSLRIAAGDGQSGAIQAQLAKPLVVKVTAADGLGVQGATVNFSITSGTGTLIDPTALSGPDGAAQTKLILGNTLGPVTVTAKVTGLPAAQFGATALAPLPPVPGAIALNTPQPSVQLGTCVSGPYGLGPRVFDWNGDGIPDIVSLGQSCLSVSLGKGDGTFRTPVSTPLSGIADQPCDFAIGDLNRDGRPDLIVSVCASAPQGTKVDFPYVLLGQADGSFRPPISLGINGARTLLLADFNADGVLDLLVTTLTFSGTGEISILLGKGDASFYQSAMIPFPNLGDIQAVDINGDGKLDLVMQDELTGALSVVLGKGDGTFQAPITYNVGRPWWTGGIVIADFDGDGKLDVASIQQATVVGCPASANGNSLTGGDIIAWKGNGDGTFRPWASSNVSSRGGPVCPQPLALFAGDFDGDGKLDLATIIRADPHAPDVPPVLAVLPGRGDGTFGTPQVFPLPDALSSIVACVDLNGDGKLDFVLTTYSSARIPVGVWVILNNTTPSLPVNSLITVESGDGQSATVGKPLPKPLTVRVTAPGGAALSGVPITFAVTSGTGTVNPGVVQTGADGMASSTLTLGTTLGSVVVTASFPGLRPAQFTATAFDIPSQVKIVGGNNQSGIVGASLSNPLVVQVVGQTVALAAGVPVTFAVLSGAAALSSTNVQTAADGTARTIVTLGPSAGPVVISATAVGSLVATFNLTGLADPGGFFATASYTIDTLAGSYPLGDGGAASDALLLSPGKMVFDSQGNLYIADGGNYRVRKVTADGIISTVAGTGVRGFSGDGGDATAAQLANPVGLALSAEGELLIGDGIHVRAVGVNGKIRTIAGTAASGYAGDGGMATAALLTQITALAVDTAGNLYLADWNNNRVRMVNTSGIITTLAGTGEAGYSGDGGPATLAQISSPLGLAFDNSGDLLIAEGSRLRMVSPDGTISTIAGGAVAGFGGDGGAAMSARLSQPADIAVDAAGNIFIADSAGQRVRAISPSGQISTMVGTGQLGVAGDGGPAVSAQLSRPFGLALDPGGDLYISEENHVRLVAPDGTISTAVGRSHFGGDGGPATAALMLYPQGVAVDGGGNVYIADVGN
ncbi:MAG TPA: FG-GAP-like repeat-containing protein, partial [Terriglobales bacterium]|nr:FG-GAP-like repeat-containing protein [Terriglobales bacterium]